MKLISYRVRYKLDFTMEYKISKSANIRVKFDPCGTCLPYFCLQQGFVAAADIMESLPGYREDEEFVYFTQDGELRWTTNRMDVKKKLIDI